MLSPELNSSEFKLDLVLRNEMVNVGILYLI
jgi:hypothetical protein